MTGNTVCPNILIVSEGHTEKIYLKHLSQRYAGYSVHVEKSPQEKAIKAIKTCVSIYKRDYNRKYGDVAYCIVDVDNNSEEDILRALNIAKTNKVKLILSKPCFEIFFLMHFTDTIPVRITSQETKEELKKYIPGYKETNDYWGLLLCNQQKALERSRRYVLNDSDFDLGRLSNGSNIYELFDEVERLKRRTVD